MWASNRIQQPSRIESLFVVRAEASRDELTHPDRIAALRAERGRGATEVADALNHRADLCCGRHTEAGGVSV